MAASKLTKLKPGECAFYVRGIGNCFGKLPLSSDPLARTPKSAARRIAAHDQFLDAIPWYASPEEIVAARQVFLGQLLNQLRIAVNAPDRFGIPSLPNAGDTNEGTGLILPSKSIVEVNPIPAEFQFEEPTNDTPWEF